MCYIFFNLLLNCTRMWMNLETFVLWLLSENWKLAQESFLKLSEFVPDHKCC